MSIFIDESIIPYLEREVEGFAKLNRKKENIRKNGKNIAFALLELILMNYGSIRYQHKIHRDCFYISAKRLEQMFGRDIFNNLSNKLVPQLIIKVADYSKQDGITNAYKLTDECKLLLKDFYASVSKTPAKLIDLTASIAKKKIAYKCKPPMYGINTKTESGNVIKAKFNIPSYVLINVDALLRLKRELSRDLMLCSNTEILEEFKNLHGNDPLGKINRMITQINIVIKQTNNNVCEGSMLMTYKEHVSGRFYGTGIHLQNVCKEVRNAALEGLWDYDIENCHYTLLSQLAAQAGYECEGINDYLKNRDDVRESIAKSVGITDKEVKTCLLSKIYGSKDNYYWEGAILNEIGADAAKRLYGNKVYKDISDDIKIAGDVVLDFARQNRMCRGQIKNYMNYLIDEDKHNSKEKVLANLIQSCEAKILNVVGQMSGEDLALLIHDGWVAKTKLDCELMKQTILKQTGFTVEIEEHRLDDKNSATRNQFKIAA